MDEIYVSTDVETDGPIPGTNSMLSIGSAAYLADKTLIGTFSANLQPLPGARQDPKTMEWWSQQPAAWEACRRDPQPPEKVMKEYVGWLKTLPGEPVFVAYPAGFDFMYVYWYLIQFANESPFSFAALDIKTMAMLLLQKPFGEINKAIMPSRWFDSSRHSHIALDDAIDQGTLFCNMLAEARRLPPSAP